MTQRGNAVVRGAVALLTGREGSAERASGDVRIRDGRIAAIGTIPAEPNDDVIDARGCVVYPGFVCTHHHLAQSVMKAVPAGIDRPLEGWVEDVLFRFWHRLDGRGLEIAATIGIAQLLLSGTTTVADHHFLFDDDTTTDAADVLVDVARRFGIRLVLARGGGTFVTGNHAGGRRPTPVQPLATILDHIGALAQRYHDPAPDAMLRIVAAPSTPFWSVTPDELETIARFARERALRLHTHLSETATSVEICRERYRMRPVPWLAERGWLGEDVWFAHAVHLDDEELRMLAASGTGIAHCPQSNARLGAGIAPVARFAALGGRVSLGVDGGASNESGSMIDEVHVAWLVHRAQHGASATRAEDVVRWATAAGAAVLGLGDVGEIAVGKSADLTVWPLDHPRYAGAHDEAVAPVVCGGGDARHVVIGGRRVVVDGKIPGLDLATLAAAARAIVLEMHSEAGR